MKSNLFPALFFAALSAFLLYQSHKIGYKSGYKLGEKAAISKLELQYEERLEEMDYEYKVKVQNAWTEGNNNAREIAEYECEGQLQVEQNVCNENIKKAYSLGQLNGMKRVGKVCNIKIK